MSIAKEVIVAHDGEIKVRSNIGEGTHFNIVLKIKNRQQKNHST